MIASRRVTGLSINQVCADTHGMSSILSPMVAKGGPQLKPSTGSTEPGAIYPAGMQIQNTMMSSLASFLASPLHNGHRQDRDPRELRH